LANAIGQSGKLLQTELRLVRAEVRETLNKVLGGGVLTGAGAVAALAALFLLLQAVVQWLEFAGMPSRWGYLLLGALATAGAALLLIKGTNAIRETNLIPERSIERCVLTSRPSRTNLNEQAFDQPF
jgi:hypothetical protein